MAGRPVEGPGREPIGYIRPEIPPFSEPAYQGERSERGAPDTLDVVERANRAIQFVTSWTDPDADYEIYQWNLLHRNPPIMRHDFHAGLVQPKFLEALPLLRHLTGNRSNTEVDRAWAASVLHMQGPDGLLYMPVKGRPWARSGLAPPSSGEKTAVGDDGTSDQLAALYSNGVLTGVLALYHRLIGDYVWKKAAQRIIDRMAQLMVYRDDYCYFPILTVNPGHQIDPSGQILDPECRAEGGGTVAGWLVHGLSQAYQAFGYEPALELAGKLAVYLMRHSGAYDRQARFLGMVHTHHHLKPMIGLLEYALLSSSTEMAEFATRGYEYARQCGSPTIGYIAALPGPDTLSYATVQAHFRHPAEGCTTGDYVALGLKLSQAGLADCWDDVDRCVRNHFFESQLLSLDWVDQLIQDQDLPYVPADPAKYETDERVAERNTGTFASLPAPNGMCLGFGWPGMRIMQCCSGNMLRSIYYLWDHIVTHDDGTVKANLLLNRTSPWVDLESYIPYEGRVDARVRQACELQVRMPEWVEPDELWCAVNERPHALRSEDRYAIVGAVAPGDRVSLRFPIAERTVKETIMGIDLTMAIRGNDVVHMDPAGDYYPFYVDKERYRQGEPAWRTAQRFVPSERLGWR